MSEESFSRSLGLLYFKAGVRYAAKVVLEKGLKEGLSELERLCKVLENEVDERIAEEVLSSAPYCEKIQLEPLGKC
ncbi:MAG: hypothetical protein DRJ38_10700 [Thermoprotei archaeon]|nr:MAG: hypothetical protein DRJ38_10700 [Thermoprotei archaeon]